MPLSEERIHRGRPTIHPHEREALDLVYPAISDIDPYQAWELHELHDPSSGRLYELDLAFLSRVGLFLVEIKSHPGVLTGDVVDWTFAEPGGRPRSIECPYATINHKAKVLGSLLDRLGIEDRPFVHAAVFTPNVTSVRLDGGRPPWLLLKDDVASKLVNGLDDRMPRRVVNRPMMKAILQAAHRLGLRPSRAGRIVGGFELEGLVGDGEGYQEHLAHHSELPRDRARVRSYLVPSATSTARRQQLERAAHREAQMLAQLGQHPGILRYRNYVTDGPLGPAVLFEAFDGADPLHTFLRKEPELAFDERLRILQAIVEAVAHCHRADVLHRNLSPASVLVRREEDRSLTVKLHRFQTATWIEHSSQGTRHVNELAHELDRLYQAPEVLSDAQKALAESDLFSVGCLAWILFTGQHPAPTLAERDQRLRASPETGLCPSSVRADLAALDDGVSFATRLNPHARADDVADWFDSWILDVLTRPVVEATPGPDPHKAEKGDVLGAGLRVERCLGTGGTARVFHVRREGKDYALKIPHDDPPVCKDRLLAEASVLRQLRHEHVVALHDVVTLSGRPCLLLDYAGERTLAELLRSEGSLSLELARRYGDDLLSAVQYIEERNITHRDIKPGNVGFTGYEGRQKHLLLLDFSLASADPAAVDAGTADWRDPWLYLRGRWDAAADRYAAAAVLHYALTGVRPARAEGPGVVDAVVVDPERFDAAVRDRLAAFFRRALARDVGERFDHAEEMRQAWLTALSPGESQGARPPASTVDLASVRPETPVDALPLSARARNALDRAGVPTVADLLLLPRNQLSVIRGIGTKVTREIFELAEALRGRVDLAPVEPLVPGFLRPRLSLDDEELGLGATAVDALRSAGLTSSVDAAQAPKGRLVRLIGSEATAALAVRLRTLAAGEPAPGSLGDWVRLLIGRRSGTEAQRRLRVLVGLDPFPDERPDKGVPAARSVPEVADALGIEPALLHSSLQFLRNKRWAPGEEVGEVAHALVDTLRPLLSEPAMALTKLARALAESRCAEEPTGADLTQAAALVRVALELRPHPLAAWRRLDAGPWIARDATVLDALPALSAAADALAATDPLPSTEAVRLALAEAVEGTPLAALPPDQRVILAAQVSRRAAASARMELYPRGMDAPRALKLSLSALAGGGLTPEVVRRRVGARYPDAQPLPGRPDLDLLLAPHGLVYSPDAGEYARPGQVTPTSMTVQLPPRARTAGAGLPARRDPDAQRAAAFQDQLDRGVASRRFRVVQVRADLAAAAAERLGEALGVVPLSLDHALAEAIRARAAVDDVQWESVEAADRAGPEGPDWPLLVGLVRDAADAMVASLLGGDHAPRVLVWPGALARYGLAGALGRLVEGAERGDTGAVLLVVPSYADGLAPSINGRLPVPAPLPGQRLNLPEPWLANAHRAAESA